MELILSFSRCSSYLDSGLSCLFEADVLCHNEQSHSDTQRLLTVTAISSGCHVHPSLSPSSSSSYSSFSFHSLFVCFLFNCKHMWRVSTRCCQTGCLWHCCFSLSELRALARCKIYMLSKWRVGVNIMLRNVQSGNVTLTYCSVDIIFI